MYGVQGMYGCTVRTLFCGVWLHLILITGLNLACSKGPLAGDTTFREAKKALKMI
jgi:hypothetical protein